MPVCRPTTSLQKGVLLVAQEQRRKAHPYLVLLTKPGQLGNNGRFPGERAKAGDLSCRSQSGGDSDHKVQSFSRWLGGSTSECPSAEALASSRLANDLVSIAAYVADLNSRRNTFPAADIGNDATNSIWRGIL
jgi:hypothetical protein